jgi:hypothetical protein
MSARPDAADPNTCRSQSGGGILHGLDRGPRVWVSLWIPRTGLAVDPAYGSRCGSLVWVLLWIPRVGLAVDPACGSRYGSRGGRCHGVWIPPRLRVALHRHEYAEEMELRTEEDLRRERARVRSLDV